MTKTVQSLARLILKNFRNLKLSIIFRIFLLFYLLLNLIILSNVYIILLLSRALHGHNTSMYVCIHTYIHTYIYIYIY